MLVWIICVLNCQTFCYQTWYGDASLRARVSYKMTGLLFSRTKWYQGLVCSKYNRFYYIFWTADSFATNLRSMVHYHEAECLMKKLDYYVRGPGHSKTLKCQWRFVQMIFSEPLNILLSNLEWWCIIVSQSIFQKDWFAVV